MSVIKKDNSKMNIGRSKHDGCKLLSSFYGGNIVGKFFKRIQSVSNIPKKCPVPAVSNLMTFAINYIYYDTYYYV